MKTIVLLGFIALMSVNACASSQPAEACGAANTCGATKPDLEKARSHLQKHVSYPATRGDILAACAQTPEFTESEKRWFSDSLPEGNYASADDAIRALKL